MEIASKKHVETYCMEREQVDNQEKYRNGSCDAGKHDSIETR